MPIYVSKVCTCGEDLDAALAAALDTKDMVEAIQKDMDTASAKFAAIEQEIADLKYKPIAISSFTNDVNTVERGREIKSVVLTWALNKDATAQKLDGVGISAALRKYTKTPQTPITADTRFDLEVTDERDKTAVSTTWVRFSQRVYGGSLPSGVLPTRDEVLALSSKLQNSMSMSIPYTPTTGKRATFVCPHSYVERFGEPTFTDGLNKYNWVHLGVIKNFENASGYVEDHDVWQHPVDVNSGVTFQVS